MSPSSGTAGKMSPPLRSRDDREAILEGLADDTIDVIATDHAPHTIKEKLRAFPDAPNGILGLETAVGSTLSALVHGDVLTLEQVIDKMTATPARLYGIAGGTLSEGTSGDVTLIDLDAEWQVDATAFRSKSRNTPFHGWRFPWPSRGDDPRRPLHAQARARPSILLRFMIEVFFTL